MKITRTTAPVHPGRLLARELAARDLTPENADRELDLHKGTIAGILGGQAVTTATAAALERGWGTPARTWLALQQGFDGHPKHTHGGARPGAGRPASGLTTEQLRITGTPEQLADIKAWLALAGRGNGARMAADALHRAAQNQRQ